MFIIKVIIALISGILIGFIIFPQNILPFLDYLINLNLCFLLFFAGYEIGKAPNITKGLKEASSIVSLILLSTIFGSIIGAFIAGQIIGFNPSYSMSIGAGFGWYSLTGPLLMQYINPYIGAVGFTSNILREILTMLLFPYFEKIFGTFAAISMGGATTMDSTLPIIIKTVSDKKYILIAFIHGAILTILAPILIPFILSI
ncbi:MAG: lysine exporter LysO family protein [Nitrososphaerota archaeon]